MIVASPGSRSRTGCQRASSAAPSSTAIRASQSAATYAICSGASVAYNVTPRPPAWTAPRSASTCSLRFGSISTTRSPGASPRAANPAATSSTLCRACDQVRDCQPSPVPASSEYASASPEVSATCRNSSHSVRPAIAPSISARCRVMSLLTVSSTLRRRTLATSDGLDHVVADTVEVTSPRERADHQARRLSTPDENTAPRPAGLPEYQPQGSGGEADRQCNV